MILHPLLLLKQTSPITLNPSTNQIRVIVTTLQQLLVCSLSRYHTIVNHEDGIHNAAQTMCHHSRMSLSPRLQRRQELILILAVQRTRRFVQKEDRGIAQNRSRQRQTLLLTSRYRFSHCSQIGIESIGHLVAKSKHNASSNSASVSVLSTPSWRLERMVPANITGS